MLYGVRELSAGAARAAALTSALLVLTANCVQAGNAPAPACAVRARTRAGWVCGTHRYGAAGSIYASFRGVPYAKQPLGKLRFQELQPLEPWDTYFEAFDEGPICPQTDVLYGPLMQPQGMSEACIHANIHVPNYALPSTIQGRSARELQPPYSIGFEDQRMNQTGLPILVFIHGGGFAFGSGDSDMHGPENLLRKDVIVITFNYRLNVFGFLSLNSTSIPGNAGLRDMITLLRWVKQNARAFGGNPDDVTIAGQSAGSSAAHLLTLSPAAKGLFKRAILMSGTAIPSFYTTSPVYAQFVANIFLTSLGIKSTDPEEIHQELIETPIEKIIEANKFVLDQIGTVNFFPVIESPLPGVTTVLDEDTEVSIAKGRGNDIPLLVGFTTAECEVFRPRFEEVDILARLKNPLTVLSPSITFSVPPAVALERAKQVEDRYFDGEPDLDSFIKVCSDTYFVYPALKLAQYRQATGGAPVFLYQFGFEADYSVIKEALKLNYTGAAHVEDLTNIFFVKSVRVAHSTWDDHMKDLMTTFVTNFMSCSKPNCQDGGFYVWRPVEADEINYQRLESPTLHHPTELTPEQDGMLRFFNSINQRPSTAWFVDACDVYARTESGRVCGLKRTAENNVEYASFRGVPYAKQPLGELRFKELEPAEPWDLFIATTEGPVCPQIDRLYGKLMQPQGMSEACIHANIHVPIDVFPKEDSNDKIVGVPVIVYIHGGGFQSGSGDSDIYGPEYLVSKGAIIITFNYRLNVFGFLSLNSANIPGNQGLRDMLTLLRWVQKNVRSFGGNPDDVTVMGQSSGATSADLLALSPHTEGLFKRVVIMSGTALPSYYTTSPVYAQTLAHLLLTNLGITSTDVEEIYEQLIALPLDTIMTAYSVVQDSASIVAFAPVLESCFDGVTRMVDQYPDEMIKAGYESNLPYVIGFDTAECYSLQSRVKELNPVPAVEQSPLALLPPRLLYATPEKALPNATLLEKAIALERRYFSDSVTFEKYLDYCSDSFFILPALRRAQLRAEIGGAPTYLYQFSYIAENSTIKSAFGLSYDGAGHMEDTLFAFRVNSQLGDHKSFPPTNKDDSMKDWFSNIFINFMNTGSPSKYRKLWPAVNNRTLMYQDINAPQVYSYTELTEAQKETLQLFTSVFDL